jgi:hypothetical protein
MQQLQNSAYTEYDENTLPTLLTSIKARGRQRLQGEAAE